MKTKYFLSITVTASALLVGTHAFAQSALIINPQPLSGAAAEAPSDAMLPAPIDVTEQKLRNERSFLDSIVVPQPGSDYFSLQPVETNEEPPSDEVLAPVENVDYGDVNEYERWAKEQREKYQHDDSVTPEPMLKDMEVAEPVTQRPTSYNGEERLSNAPEIQEQIRGVVEDDSVNYQPVVSQADWNALEGNSVRQVLEVWTREADVELMWRSDNDFAVLNPFVMRSTFERAVQKLLDQYQDNQVRPVATLHIDPDLGTKILLVREIEQ